MLTINDVNYVLVERKKVFNTTAMKEVSVHEVSDGSHFFLARGVEEVVKVSLGLFVLRSEGLFHLPFDEWHQVRVGYLDDDVSNLSPDNLYPIYPEEGIPYPGKEGFYYIPQYELNAIDKYGMVYRSLRDSCYPKSYFDEPVISGGYPIAKLDGVKGDQRRYVHRLLAVTFNKPPKHYPNLQVDHDDGDKLNFQLGNLVWVTRSENNNKALYQQGLRSDNNPIDVLDMETGSILNYLAQVEFARAMGVDPWVIGLVMKRKRSVYKDRYVLKGEDDSRTFKEIFDTPKTSIKGLRSRNVFTLEEASYPSVLVAGRITGASGGSIRLALATGNPRAVFKNLQFKLDSDETPWIDLNEYELECVRRGLRSDSSAYELTDIATGQSQIVYGNDGVAKLTGADPRTVMDCARTGKRLLKKYVLKKLTR